MQRTWYITKNRAKVNWSTAVVNGKATVDIYRLEDVEGTNNDSLRVWRPTGAPVSAKQLYAAQDAQSTDPVPPAPLRGPGSGLVTDDRVAEQVTHGTKTRQAVQDLVGNVDLSSYTKKADADALYAAKGAFSLVQTDQIAMNAGRRLALLQPFSETSLWALPMGTAATFEAATDPRTSRMIRNTLTAWINEGNYSHPITQAKTSDPLAKVTDTVDGSRSTTIRIPADATIAPGTDRHMHIVSPDGQYLDEFFYAQRQSPTAYTCSRHQRVKLNGDGLGPQNGTRAYGGSAIGGLIRKWEVDPTHPKYTGRIDHPLAIALQSDQLLYTGGPSGYDGAGYGTALGYTWPATEQDYDSPSSYSGLVPMGSYLGIPSTVDVTTLGLSSWGVMIARALQDYGAYVTDRSGNFTFYVEPGANSDFVGALLGPSWTARDLNTIRAQCRLITNNSRTTPNAAALDGPRRAPLPTALASADFVTSDQLTRRLAGSASDVNAVTAGGSAQILPDKAKHRLVLNSAACTLTFPAVSAGKTIQVSLVQDGTGGRRVAWPNTVRWEHTNAPLLASRPDGVDTFEFTSFNGVTWQGRRLYGQSLQQLGTTLFYEDFGAGDGGNVSGRTLTAGGVVWQSTNDSPKVDSTRRLRAGASYVGTHCFIEVGRTDYHVALRTEGGPEACIQFRYSATNNRWIASPTDLRKVVAGTETVVTTWATPTVAGDLLEVISTTTSLTVIRNGAVIATSTDTALADQTKCGVVFLTGSSTAQGDDFRVRALPA